MSQPLNLKQKFKSLSLGLIGSTAVLTLGISQKLQAASLSYAYAYQQISGLVFTNLSTGTNGNIVSLEPNNAAFQFQPSASSSASVNAGGNGDSSSLDPQQAIVSNVGGTGLLNNTGFFNGLGNAFQSQWNTNGLPGGNADFSRSDAWMAVNDGTNTSTITGAPQLTDLLLGQTSGTLLLGNVAESYIFLPPSSGNIGGQPGDEGGASGNWSISSTTFTVTQNTSVGVNFSFLNGLANQLTNGSNSNLALASARLNYIIAINEVDGSGDVLSTPLLFNSGNPNFLLSTIVTQEYQQGGFSDPLSLTTTTDLVVGNRYTISIQSNAIVNTRVVTEEVPEPSSVVALLGLGFLGLVAHRKK